ncbi:MAG: MBL fold metallo-hydrolase [Burkholderiales bacterium]|nr:MBL fold metallo-hydrolase [Burkholderiales bacterium]
MRITFLGAAEEVTGSCFLVETSRTRFLVDCGMFQGGRDADGKNHDALDIDVRTLDFVLLTHAHIDHSGLLPRLVVLGFRGPIWCTEPTADLLGVMLPDSAHIQEKEAEWSTRRRVREHRRGEADPAPLYTVVQSLQTLKQLKPVKYGNEARPHDTVRCRFRDAGHILGSSFIEVQVEDGPQARKLVFSGDLGQPGHPLVRDHEFPSEADVLIMESTYGNRLHRPMAETLTELAEAVTDTLVNRGGNVVIPAFAVGRAQDIVYLLLRLHREGRVPDMKIYVDSPMALEATKVTLKHLDTLEPEAREGMAWLRSRRGQPEILFTQDVEDSIAINQVRSGAVIISASGMCEAGRIKYHLRENLPRAESAVVICGFQAGGTLGRRIVDGATTVRLFGDEVPVRARVHTIGGLSAHGDQAALLDWLGHFERPPGSVFLVHGERSTQHMFRDVIVDRLGWPDIRVPAPGETVEL